MSTIQISSGDKRSRTSAPIALAALLAVGMAAVVTAAPAVAQEKMTTLLRRRRSPTSYSSWVTTSAGCSRASITEGLAVGETPNIDRIGNEGAKFMTYYAEQSCTAGRNAFITGMQPVRVGMVLPEIPGSPSYLRTGTPTLAKFLLDLGYTTGEFGKNHLGDTHRGAADGARLPGILGLSLSPRCHAAGELPRHQQVPDGADGRTTLQEHAHSAACLRFLAPSTPRQQLA